MAADGYSTLEELAASMSRGAILYRWTPPPLDRDPNYCDVPEEYAVIALPGRRDRVMICGSYRGLWHCNAPARSLVAHLLDIIAGMQPIVDTAKNLDKMRLIRGSRGPYCSAECLSQCDECVAISAFRLAVALNMKVVKP